MRPAGGRGRAGLLRRISASVIVTGACLGYLAWKVNVREAWTLLSAARLAPFLGAVAIVIVVIVPLAWRWQLLLRARGVVDRLPWLVRSSYVAQTVGQVLPTGIGGDAMRIFETSRRHPAARSAATGSVLLERLLGGCATLVLAAVGFLLASGRDPVSGMVGLELALGAGALAAAVTIFSRRARRPLRSLVPLLRKARLERPLRHAYEALHGYRDRPRLLVGTFALTLAVQAVRVLAIWLTARAAGIDLSPRPFYVMGPLLFLVGLVPFTINGFAVRESLFVSFLGGFGVPADQAFVNGFLYLLLAFALAVPGGIILGFEAARRVRRHGAQPAAIRPPPRLRNARLRYRHVRRDGARRTRAERRSEPVG